MKLTELQKFDFRWIVAALPILIILAGIVATPPTSEASLQSALDGYSSPERAVDSESNAFPLNGRAVSGMAGESQPATAPEARWSAYSFYSSKEQSRKDRQFLGIAVGQAICRFEVNSSMSGRTSLGSVSGRLSRLYTLVGLKPSGTS